MAIGRIGVRFAKLLVQYAGDLAISELDTCMAIYRDVGQEGLEIFSYADGSLRSSCVFTRREGLNP